jgi:hypothetical protein
VTRDKEVATAVQNELYYIPTLTSLQEVQLPGMNLWYLYTANRLASVYGDWLYVARQAWRSAAAAAAAAAAEEEEES